MKSYKQVKKELLKDVTTFKLAAPTEPGYAVVRQFIQRRIELGLTQAELATRLHTTQAKISYFESGASNPTLKFLFNLSHALEAGLKIRLS